MGDVLKNEETRFSNLNTRGVAVLSATSLVTALAGVFAKDVFGATFDGWGRTVGRLGIIAAVALLAATAWRVVEGVLIPGPRYVFGDNDLTNTPSSVNSADHVNAVAFQEYLAIYKVLVIRNKAKAEALNDGYHLFLGAVAVISATTIAVIVSAF